MTTITLEVPDELAAQVTTLRGRLPDMLAKVLKLESAREDLQANGTQKVMPLYREIIDFLAADPLPEEVAAFKISTAAQQRLEDLLDKNREEGLTADETVELDAYLQARDLIILLKADARLVA